MRRETIVINWNCEKSISKAEKKKSKLENQGFNLIYSTTTKLIYERP